MTNVTEPSDAGQEQTQAPPDLQDWFLENLVNIANNGGIGFSVILNVGGSLISGQIASRRRYFEEFAANAQTAFEQITSSEDAASAAEAFRELGDPQPGGSESAEGEEARPIPPTYIHLENAQFWTPGMPNPVPTKGGCWWRGRLAAVDGFSVGTLEAIRTG